MSRPVHLGLLGCGLWGRTLLEEALKLGARVSVVDPSEQSRAIAGQSGAAEVFSRSAELGPVDGIIVASPASTHFEVINEMLERNVPIFSEKPFTLDLAQAEDLAHRGGDRIFVLHVWRYHPGVQALREIVRGGEIGEIEWLRTFRTNWTSPRRDCDPVWTLLPHDFSIVLEVTGSLPPPQFVRAELSSGHPVGLLAELGGEYPCIAEVSTRYADKRREIRVHGSEGVAEIGSEGTEVRIHMGTMDSQRPLTRRIELGDRSALENEVSAVIAYLRGGPAPVSGVAEALLIARRMHETRARAGI